MDGALIAFVAPAGATLYGDSAPSERLGQLFSGARHPVFDGLGRKPEQCGRLLLEKPPGTVRSSGSFSRFGGAAQQGRYRHGAFLVARFARIYPMNLLMLVFMLAMVTGGR